MRNSWHMMAIGIWLAGGALFAAEPTTVNVDEATAMTGTARKPQDDAELRRWLAIMDHHRLTPREICIATGMSEDQIAAARARLGPLQKVSTTGRNLVLLPYPGGRHPRIGFLDGAIRPQRETKVSVFTPWDAASYVVVDVPEAIWSNLGLMYLAHTHVPTVWSRQAIVLEPLEWRTSPGGGLEIERVLPNGVAFGARADAETDGVQFELWLRNGTSATLSDLRVQNCVMLRQAEGFAEQTETNKRYRAPFAAARDATGQRWIITAWEGCHRAWGNAPCPCLHSDPQFADCGPGKTRRLRGWLSFYEGREIEAEFDRLAARFDWLRANEEPAP